LKSFILGEEKVRFSF